MTKVDLKSLEVREALVRKLGKKYVPGFQDFIIMELTTDIAPLAVGFDNNLNKVLAALAESTENGYFNMKDKYVFVYDECIYSVKVKEYKKYIDFCYEIINDCLVANELKLDIECKALTVETFGFRNVKKKNKKENNILSSNDVRDVVDANKEKNIEKPHYNNNSDVKY